MIVVTGVIVARPETVDQLVEASLDHVHRSRTEPGCLAHHVHVDVEDPLRLVFIERWADRAALDEHFRQVGSIEFVPSSTCGPRSAPHGDLHRARPARPAPPPPSPAPD